MKVIAGRLVQQTISALIALAAGLLTARWLGPQGKGVLAIVLLVSGVISQIATLGLHDAAAFLINREQFPIARLRTAFDRYIVFWGIPLGTLVALMMSRWAETLWLEPISVTVAAATGVIVVARLGSLLYKGLLLADERFHRVAMLDFIDAIVPGVIFVAGSMRSRPSVPLACGSFLCAALIVASGARFASPSAREAKSDRSSERSLAEALFRYGSKTYVRQVGVTVLARLDVFLVGHFLGIGAVGVYSVTLTLAEVIIRLPDAVAWTLLPRASRLTDDAARITTARFTRFCICVAAMAAFPYALLARYVILLCLPATFATAAQALAIIMVGTVASTVTRILGADLVARGRAGIVATITWITVGTLAFDFWLIPTFGVAGAAAGSSLAQIIAAIVMATAYSRESNIRLRTLLLLDRRDLVMVQSSVPILFSRRPAFEGTAGRL